MSWQPIETAPKRGYIIGAWKDGKWHAREMWWDDMHDEWTDTMGDHFLKPTHWIEWPGDAEQQPAAPASLARYLLRLQAIVGDMDSELNGTAANQKEPLPVCPHHVPLDQCKVCTSAVGIATNG